MKYLDEQCVFDYHPDLAKAVMFHLSFMVLCQKPDR
jgi:hypothetical protein